MSRKHNNISTVPLHPGIPKQPVVAKYDPLLKGVKSELADAVVMANYKSDKNQVPMTLSNGSTVPLMEVSPGSEELGDYDPFQHRKLTHPTSDLDTLIHLLKGSLGSGILAMPLAFSHAGLWFGLAATFAIGVICTYCVHILVKSAHILCHRRRVPSLGFADVAEAAFLSGPPGLHKYSRLAKAIINTFLVVDLVGCCCVYIVFVATNLKQVADHYMDAGDSYGLRVYMLMLLVPLVLLSCIRNLKYLAPFSMIANVLIAIGVSITFYYILDGLPATSERPAIAPCRNWPMFFGTAIFALEGIGVVMSLENNMKTPTHFIGCPGVLNLGMSFVVALYSTVGFFGFLKYGNDTEGSITLNLPKDQVLSQSVKVIIAIAIFFTYGLQFYVPFEIMWKNIKSRFGGTKQLAAEYAFRMTLVCVTVAIAVAVPNLGGFISLVGAVCLSTLGLIFPSVIECITFWDDPGMGRFGWRLWKNLLLIAFGCIGFVTGTYVSILEIAADIA